MKDQKLAIVILLLFAFFYFRPVYAEDDGIVLFKDSINNAEIATLTNSNDIILDSTTTVNIKNQDKNISSAISTDTANSNLLWEGTIEDSTASGTFSSSSPFSQAFSYLTYLSLLIIILIITSYVLQKKGLIRNNVYGKVVGVIPLDTKRIIYITEIVGKYYILGVTEYSINKIDEVSNEEIIKLIKLTNKKPKDPKITFEKMLKETSTIPIVPNNNANNKKDEDNNSSLTKEPPKDRNMASSDKIKDLLSLINKKNESGI